MNPQVPLFMDKSLSHMDTRPGEPEGTQWPSRVQVFVATVGLDGSIQDVSSKKPEPGHYVERLGTGIQSQQFKINEFANCPEKKVISGQRLSQAKRSKRNPPAKQTRFAVVQLKAPYSLAFAPEYGSNLVAKRSRHSNAPLDFKGPRILLPRG